MTATQTPTTARYRPLCRELADLLASFPDAPGFTAAQRARWQAPLRPWMLARPSPDDGGEVLRLLVADGGDGEPVGDRSVSTVQKWLNPFTGNLAPDHRSLIRFAAWCRLDLRATLTLVLKRDWEDWVKPRYGWEVHKGFCGDAPAGADPELVARIARKPLEAALNLLAQHRDKAERLAFFKDLPGKLEGPRLENYARRLAHEIRGAGYPPHVDPGRISRTVKRLVAGYAIFAPVARGAPRECDGKALAARREEVLAAVRTALDYHADYQATLGKYRGFLADREGQLVALVAAERRRALAQALLAALRAQCRVATAAIDAAQVRRLCRRVRQEQAEARANAAGPGAAPGPVAQILGQPLFRAPLADYRKDPGLRRALLRLLHPDRALRDRDSSESERIERWQRLNAVFAACKALIDQGEIAAVLERSLALGLDLGQVLTGEREIATALEAIAGLCEPDFWQAKIARVEALYDSQTIPLGGGAGVSVAQLAAVAQQTQSDWSERLRPELELAADQCESGMTEDARALLRRLCAALDDPEQTGLAGQCGEPEDAGNSY
jgi:hypothetical protein